MKKLLCYLGFHVNVRFKQVWPFNYRLGYKCKRCGRVSYYFTASGEDATNMQIMDEVRERLEKEGGISLKVL